jgi:CheY-like chemotaxis protein
MNAVIRGMEELLRHSLSGAVSLEFLPGKELWVTSVDLSGLETCLLNLVVNARDAMPQGGTVTIETANVTQTVIGSDGRLATPGTEFVRLTVADTGTGMPREIAARAAEPLFTTKPAGKGTGLGLYQVTSFATASGGRVEIDSEPGRGTTVRIYLLRLLAEEPVSLAEPGLRRAGVARGRGECVLVVENETEILAFVVEELTELGYRALGAANASSALTLLEATPDISVLLTDLGLLGIDGQQLAREALRRRPDLVVIYASGGPKAGKDEAAPAKPDIPLVLKPYSAEEVGLTIRAMLDKAMPVNDVAAPG